MKFLTFKTKKTDLGRFWPEDIYIVNFHFLYQNINFLKFSKDISPISKLDACHTIQDGGIISLALKRLK